jgi:AmmeMemoRadiSam system protein B/AmmeMemoRadiSam system protein A
MMKPTRATRLAALAGLLVAVSLPALGAGSVRPPALVGSWYPDSPALVYSEIDRMRRSAEAAPLPGRTPLALVVPHAGWRYSGVAAAAAFRTVRAEEVARVVVMAPSHRGSFRGFSIAGVEAYETPLGRIPLCGEAVKALRDGKLVQAVDSAHRQEHAIEIELPFLQERLESFCLVPVLAGFTDARMQREMAARLAKLDDGRTLFVFSTDFTHYGPRYGYTPHGGSAVKAREAIARLDERALTYFSAADAQGFRDFLAETSCTVCGRHGLGVLLELLPLIAPETSPVRLAGYASIDLPGMADDNSVSYFALAWPRGEAPKGEALGPPPEYPSSPPDAPLLDEETGRKLLAVARATIETELRGVDDLRGALAALPEGRAELDRLQAAFVTLNRTDPQEIARKGKLRGCIGQVAPTYPLPQAIVVAAQGAALHDRRFEPVRAEELDGLEVELTLLSTPGPIASWRNIVIGKHGIVLYKGRNRAVYLPHVATEQGWGLEETLTHLARKAGLPPDGWREGARFEVFEGQVFAEGHQEGDSHGH